MNTLREACATQIQRLHGTKGYPLTVPGLRDLVDALEEAGSAATATAIVGEIVDGLERGDWCPTAAEIRRAAEARRPGGFGCEKCDGTGWVFVEKGFTTGASAVKKCDCRKAVTE